MVISGGSSAAYPSMGNTITGQVSQLENIENGWTSITALNVPRFAHGCGVIVQGETEKIVVAGGIGQELVELDSVEVYTVGLSSPQSWSMGGCNPNAKMLPRQDFPINPSTNFELGFRHPSPRGNEQGEQCPGAREFCSRRWSC